MKSSDTLKTFEAAGAFRGDTPWYRMTYRAYLDQSLVAESPSLPELFYKFSLAQLAVFPRRHSFSWVWFDGFSEKVLTLNGKPVGVLA